ncbi:MAG: class I SAM-dependent methyltransferase [Acidimicrobiales bacterium]
MRSAEHRVAALLQDHPILYSAARRLRTGLGEWLPPQHVAGVGLVHRNDLMFLGRRASGIADYKRAGDEAAELCAAALDLVAHGAPASVFDLGCGHGRCLRALRARWPTAHTIAADVDAGAVRFCSQRLGARGEVLDVTATSLPGGGYDLLWAGSVFTHLTEGGSASLLRAVRDALAPNAVAVLTTHGPDTLPELPVTIENRGAALAALEAEGFAFQPYRDEISYGLTWFEPHRFAAMAAVAGLTVRSHQPRGWMSFQDVWTVTPEPL